MAQVKKVNVITGCAGFLGSRLTELLNAGGEAVIGYDNLDRGMVSVKNLHDIQNPLFKFVAGDILDFKRLKDVINGADRVFHFAAYPSHRLALERPHAYMSVDLQGTANVLEAARLSIATPLVVFASSNKVYGKQECPWREDKLPQPEGPYAVAKYGAEMLCEMYTKYFRVPSLVLRYHHVAGPRSNPELALSIFVEQAMKGGILQVHGKRTPVGWQSCSANYTHVDDAMRATLLAADNYSGFDIFNIANEKTITVESMARWVIARLNSKSTVDLVDMLSHETLVHASDVSKARDRFGFTAEKPAEEAFADYTEWRLNQ
jgi:nucleoside-diphosphate-sugar epimerase